VVVDRDRAAEEYRLHVAAEVALGHVAAGADRGVQLDQLVDQGLAGAEGGVVPLDQFAAGLGVAALDPGQVALVPAGLRGRAAERHAGGFPELAHPAADHKASLRWPHGVLPWHSRSIVAHCDNTVTL
jgi:hypothetical protein